MRESRGALDLAREQLRTLLERVPKRPGERLRLRQAVGRQRGDQDGDQRQPDEEKAAALSGSPWMLGSSADNGPSVRERS